MKWQRQHHHKGFFHLRTRKNGKDLDITIWKLFSRRIKEKNGLSAEQAIGFDGQRRINAGKMWSI